MPIDLSSEDLNGLLDLLNVLERTEPLTELQLFYLHQKAHKEKVAWVLGGLIDPDPAGSFPSLEKGFLKSVEANLSLQTEIGWQNFERWAKLGDKMILGWVQNIRRILTKAGLHELAARWTAAVARHPMPVGKVAIQHDDPELQRMQYLAPLLHITLSNARDPQTGNFAFEICCADCGGYVLECPEGEDPSGPVYCLACSQVFGPLRNIQALAAFIGKIGLRERGFATDGKLVTQA